MSLSPAWLGTAVTDACCETRNDYKQHGHQCCLGVSTIRPFLLRCQEVDPWCAIPLISRARFAEHSGLPESLGSPNRAAATPLLAHLMVLGPWPAIRNHLLADATDELPVAFSAFGVWSTAVSPEDDTSWTRHEASTPGPTHSFDLHEWRPSYL